MSLRRLFRTWRARAGQEVDLWPGILCLLVLLLPAACLLWFMGSAMRNERLAARQKLAEAYRGHLSHSRQQLLQFWREQSSELEKLARTMPASAAFARCVESGFVDSVLLFDQQEQLVYPDQPSAIPPEPKEWTTAWDEAGRLEYTRRDFRGAIRQYHAMATNAAQATNSTLAARAWQAEARCLIQSGQPEAAAALVTETLSQPLYDHAVDRQGRLIAANAELMVLELATNRQSTLFEATAVRLAQRLTNYAGSLPAASQRFFLMKELHQLAPELSLPTLPAEELAAQISARRPTAREENILHRTSLPDVWQFRTPDRRVLGIVRSGRLLAWFREVSAKEALPADASITLVPPDVDPAAALITLSAGDPWPGWRFALSMRDQKLFDAETERQAAAYLWGGILVIAAMAGLTVLLLRLLQRRVALTRLKNDLVATVSHELRTPLSSMRVLVDTLLDAEKWNEQIAREYLQLIAQENERLSRLIQNFLTFSRMERGKHNFHFKPVPSHELIEAAARTVRERFAVPGCQFTIEVDTTLPPVWADPDALLTALVNLLENAYRYSGESKQIILGAHATNGAVVFSVQDNGVGIPPGERKKILRPFYQVDQRLTRQGGGCGLGLSIVQFIVNAHGGALATESRLEGGSKFTITLPALNAADNAKEAIA